MKNWLDDEQETVVQPLCLETIFLDKTMLGQIRKEILNKMRIDIDENKCLGYNMIRYIEAFGKDM